MVKNRRPQIQSKRGSLEAFVEHQASALEHGGKALFHLVPREARRHARSAARECLLSFRALIDGAVDVLEQEKDREEAAEPTKKKIKVEVE